ncbi:MAG: hypothetical protein ACEY3J_01965 [Arsenophonus sp.]
MNPKQLNIAMEPILFHEVDTGVVMIDNIYLHSDINSINNAL